MAYYDDCKLKLREEQLKLLKPEEWKELCDLYIREYPKHVLSYNLLKTYVEWHQRNLIRNNVFIYTCDDNWREHGVFIVKDRIGLLLNIHFNALYAAGLPLLYKALRKLDRVPHFILFGYPGRIQNVVDHYVKHFKFDNVSQLMHNTVLYYMPKAEAMKLEERQIPGFVAKQLTDENIQQVNLSWPHRGAGTLQYIARLIVNNMTLGIFNELNNELCAWAFHSELGTVAILQVDIRYQRNGFGETIVGMMAKRIAEVKKIDVTATVIESNIPSCKLFEKLGFVAIGTAKWMVKPPLALAPLED